MASLPWHERTVNDLRKIYELDPNYFEKHYVNNPSYPSDRVYAESLNQEIANLQKVVTLLQKDKEEIYSMYIKQLEIIEKLQEDKRLLQEEVAKIHSRYEILDI